MSARALAAALCLALAGGAAFAADVDVDAEQKRIEAATAEIERLVAQIPADDDDAIREVARRLVDLPEETRPALLPIVRAGLLDRPETVRYRVTDRTLELLGEGRRSELFRPLAAAEANLDDRVFLLWYIREHGLRGGVALGLSAARGAPEIERRAQVLRGALRAAVARQAQRDPSGLETLSRQFARLPGEFQRTLLQGAEEIAPQRTAHFVAGLLHPGGDHDLYVLQCLARLPVLDARALDLRTSGRIVDSLDSEDVLVRRAAAACIGRLHVTEGAPRLIDALSDADVSVAKVALQALRRMTTSQLGARPGDWTEFLEREAEWLAEEAPERLSMLNGSEEDVLAALRGLGRHRLHRDRLWRPVADALRSGTVDVRRSACDVLGALGEPGSIPGLLRSVADDDASVAEAASKALARITTLRTPDAPASWIDRLDPVDG